MDIYTLYLKIKLKNIYLYRLITIVVTLRYFINLLILILGVIYLEFDQNSQKFTVDLALQYLRPVSQKLLCA